MDRIGFSYYEAVDFDLYFRLVGNPEVMGFEPSRALSRKEALVTFEEALAVNRMFPGYGQFKVFDRTERQFIGLAKLAVTGVDELEYGCLLLPQYWGRGYATEICSRLLVMARADPQYALVTAYVHPDNNASRKVLSKCGFQSVTTGPLNEKLSVMLKEDYRVRT